MQEKMFTYSYREIRTQIQRVAVSLAYYQIGHYADIHVYKRISQISIKFRFLNFQDSS